MNRITDTGYHELEGEAVLSLGVFVSRVKSIFSFSILV